MMRRLQDEKQRFSRPLALLFTFFDFVGRMMEERELLILGQQEHEQLLDEEISQLKRVLQEKEKELMYAYSLSKESAVRMQQQRLVQPRSDMDIVERLESLEQEVVQLRRRTPTLADLKCVAPEHHAPR